MKIPMRLVPDIHKTGFTLLELIAAMVLGVLLLSAIAMVTRSLATEIVSNRNALGSRVIGNAFEVLLDDLTNARSMGWDGRHLLLAGPIERSLDGECSLRNTMVVYEIRQRGSRSLLVRLQQNNIQPTLDSQASQIVIAEGIDFFQVSSDEPLPTPPRQEERVMTGISDSETPAINQLPLSVLISLGSTRRNVFESRVYMREGVVQ